MILGPSCYHFAEKCHVSGNIQKQKVDKLGIAQCLATLVHPSGNAYRTLLASRFWSCLKGRLLSLKDQILALKWPQ